MPTSPASPSRESISPDEDQNTAAGRHSDDEAGLDGVDAGSEDSNITQGIGPEGLLRLAEDYREPKITLSGIPTRQIAEYSKELEQTRLLPMCKGKDPSKDDEEYFIHYCFMERNYFCEELHAWESFLRQIRRDWAKRNGAAGGSIDPPPPLSEMDSLDLHTQYLEYILVVRKEAEDYKDDWMLRGWKFRHYEDFLEHIAVVHRQVVELREQRGLQDELTSQEQE